MLFRSYSVSRSYQLSNVCLTLKHHTTHFFGKISDQVDNWQGTMVKPASLRTNNGAWMNRELYTIASAGSFSEQSAGSGDVENGIDRLLRVPSEGESAVIQKMLGRSYDSVDEVEMFRKPSMGEEAPVSMFPSLNKSTDTDSAEYNSGWSENTESLSEDSLDEIFVVKKELSVNTIEDDGRTCSDSSSQVHRLSNADRSESSADSVSGDSPHVNRSKSADRSESSADSVRFDSALPCRSSSADTSESSADSTSSGSFSRSMDSGRTSSQSSSNFSVSDSSDSQSTLYTSDASYTYESSRAMRKQRRRADLENTSAGVLALQRRPSVLTDSSSSSKTPRLTLDNVEYMSTFDQASTNCDLSTVEEGISKEVATGVFFPAVIPHFVPFDAQSEVSSIGARGKEAATSFDVDDVETGGVVVSPTTGTSATVSEQIASVFQEFLEGRSKMEVFFLCLICASAIALVLLLAVLLSQL